MKIKLNNETKSLNPTFFLQIEIKDKKIGIYNNTVWEYNISFTTSFENYNQIDEICCN